MSALLEVRGLGVTRSRDGETVTLLSDVDLAVGPGESVALVGESGSGKTLTARSILGLLPAGLTATGSITVDGVTVDGDPAKTKPLRGERVALLMQDPFTLLNPLRRVGPQLADALPSAVRRNRAARSQEVERRLAEVGLDAKVAGQFPFQLSGGMRQRVGVAAALVRDPVLLIADEPTTALDVTTQREVLRLIRRVQADRGMGFILITHDLRVAFSMCERVLVLKDGRVVESGPTQEIRANPREEYTKRLLDAEPSLDKPLPPWPGVAVHDAAPALLRTVDLSKTFPGSASPALDSVSITVHEGEAVGVVGESGSGKTTLARCVVGLETPTAGSIEFAGTEFDSWASLSGADRRRQRGDVQMVFQDPYSRLNPMRSIGATLSETLHAFAKPSRRLDAEVLLERVGLPTAYAQRRPAALSGGQRQRVAIARALAAQPRLLICDEAVSALDVSVQAQILELLRELRTDLGMALLFVTHDLAVVREITDRLYVMQGGRCVESGPTDRVLTMPEDAYTRQLLQAVPREDPSWLNRRRTPPG